MCSTSRPRGTPTRRFPSDCLSASVPLRATAQISCESLGCAIRPTWSDTRSREERCPTKHGSARGNTKTIAGDHIHHPSSNPPGPPYHATVRVRLEFFDRVLDHFVKTE